MPIEQRNLTPQQQAAFFAAMKAAGQQPASGGQAPSTADQVAQQGLGNVNAVGLEQRLPGSFKDDPAGAIQYLAQKLTGPTLNVGKGGATTYTRPSNQPILNLFGITKQTPVGPNNWDSLVGAFGEQRAAQLLPSGVAQTPDGKPFVGPEMADRIRAMAATGGKPGESRSSDLADALLAKAKEIHGGDSEQYKTIEKTLAGYKKQGGLTTEEMRTIDSALVQPTKTLDQFNTPFGPAYRDRGTGKMVYLMDPKQSPIATKIIGTEGNAYKSDPTVAAVRNMLSQVPTFDTLVHSDNPAARGSIEGFAARVLAREVGVMTDKDILRNTGSRALAARFERWVKTHVSGSLTDRDVADFSQLMRDVRTTSEKVLAAQNGAYVKRAQAGLKRLGINIPENELLDQIALQADYGVYNPDKAEQTATTVAGLKQTDPNFKPVGRKDLSNIFGKK